MRARAYLGVFILLLGIGFLVAIAIWRDPPSGVVGAFAAVAGIMLALGFVTVVQSLNDPSIVPPSPEKQAPPSTPHHLQVLQHLADAASRRVADADARSAEPKASPPPAVSTGAGKTESGGYRNAFVTRRKK